MLVLIETKTTIVVLMETTKMKLSTTLVIAAIAAFFLLPVNFISLLTNDNAYWGTGLPECKSSYSDTTIKKLFTSMPLVAMTSAFPTDMVDVTEVSSTDQKRNCSAVIKTINGKSVGLTFTYNRNPNSNEFFVSAQVSDPSNLL